MRAIGKGEEADRTRGNLEERLAPRDSAGQHPPCPHRTLPAPHPPLTTPSPLPSPRTHPCRQDRMLAEWARSALLLLSEPSGGRSR